MCFSAVGYINETIIKHKTMDETAKMDKKKLTILFCPRSVDKIFKTTAFN